MNSGNLINPLSPQEFCAWKQWIMFSSLCGIFLIIILSLATVHFYWQSFCLQKAVAALQKNDATSHVKNRELLHMQQQEINQKLKTIKLWNLPYYFYEHLETLSTTIPAEVVLTSLEFELDDVVIKGQTLAIEFLLEFLHNLEQSKLFQSMNLVEMQPSCIVYKEKKLVNFTIKGKLVK